MIEPDGLLRASLHVPQQGLLFLQLPFPQDERVAAAQLVGALHWLLRLRAP